MDAAAAVAAIDALDSRDPENAHLSADEVLLSLVDPAVRDAYQRLIERCNWWVCA